MASSNAEREPSAEQSAVQDLASDDYKRRKFLKMVGGTGAAADPLAADAAAAAHHTPAPPRRPPLRQGVQAVAQQQPLVLLRPTRSARVTSASSTTR